VEVHDTTALEFGHPARGEAQDVGGICLTATEHRCQSALDVDGGAPPQLGRGGVLQDGADVVVTVGAQRRAEHPVGAEVTVIAGEPPSVRASGGGVRARLARRAGPGAMDGPESRCGQVQEDGGVCGDRLVDALAAFEAGPDEVAGIPSVYRGAGGTLELAS
jgi:hypothetical protein